ncbi:hypothetical protein [Mesorhizobium sp. M0296]|uniref:hypothetical protein n=1 Tax=Mesorhizobium sp. M0296 TaxID=2956931 RepID=UPI003337E684
MLLLEKAVRFESQNAVATGLALRGYNSSPSLNLSLAGIVCGRCVAIGEKFLLGLLTGYLATWATAKTRLFYQRQEFSERALDKFSLSLDFYYTRRGVNMNPVCHVFDSLYDSVEQLGPLPSQIKTIETRFYLSKHLPTTYC